MTKLSELPPIDQYELAKSFGQFNGTYPEFLNSRPVLQANPVQQINQLTPDQTNDEFSKLSGRRNNSLLDMFTSVPLSGGTQQAAPNRVSMPNVGSLSNYIPSMNSLSGLIPKEIPDVFGQRNPMYESLLGTPQSQALSKQSNIAGLLGAAASLVSGMGRQGGRRSAAQNIISALGSGYGASGQAYQQGLQNYGQAQQLAIQQRQQAGVQAMKMKYPDLADEFDTNPAGAFRIVSEREAAAKKPTVVSEGGTLVSPTGEVIYTSTKNKPQARMLTNQEAADANLPYKEGQIYQVDASGKLDLVQGTAPAKDNFTANYKDYLQLKQDGYAKSYEQFLKDPSFNKPQTSVTVNTGDLSKPTKSKLEEETLAAGNAITRLNSIQASYRPEYQTFKFKGAQEWSTLKDKFGNLNPEEKTQLSNYSKYKQNTTQNLNLTIKELTGTAMGVQEAERITSTLPNAGTGIFDGDSPTQFQSKLDNGVAQIKYAIARKNYSINKGLKWENTSLDKMPNIINDRGAQIAKQYNLDPKKPADLTTINRQLAAEFGINF
jgi:hypothetical protein